ncbi:MAG: hypothetical protein WCR02_11670 [Sphaerochaetaceae bacterium]
MKLGKKWVDEAESMEVLSYCAKIKAPTASMHGDRDDTVPFREANSMACSYL